MKILHKGTTNREFTKIPNKVFICGLSTDAIALYALLAFHRSGFSQSQAQLMDTLGISRYKIAKVLKELVDAGLVVLGDKNKSGAYETITVDLDVTPQQPQPQPIPSPVYNTTSEQPHPKTQATPQLTEPSSTTPSLDDLRAQFGL